MPSLSPLARKVRALLQEYNYSPGAVRMLCGLSGGADSVALVLVLREMGFEVVGLHCNFQLRGAESERDERFVHEFCAAEGVQLLTTRFDTLAEAEAHGESIEMAARRLRYAWFAEVADAGEGRSAVCVAHHADDNVETMLLNLVRGAGLHGLTGMQVENDLGILRPLLTSTRQEIEAYLSERGQTFIVDSTNADVQYRRNKIRHEVLPLLRTLNPSIDRTLTETMHRLREAENALLAPADAANPYRETQQLLALGFTSAQIDQMRSATNGAYTTAGRTMLTKHRGQLLWGEIPAAVAPTPVAFRRVPRSEVTNLRNPDRGVFDAAAVRGSLFVRSVQEGDRFVPFGMKGSKLVSDYLTDRHRSRLDKLAQLCVCDDEGIVWLVGETIAQRVAVTAATTEVLVMENVKM